ncbi:hypothetical protein [Chroococcus sp. FPU101]|nr:hypothetical protein [Chroococcus sp. FPU101]GFE69852.1 hypothetical protein CFPU101_24620 [Chroococcus sp. FPU101]
MLQGQVEMHKRYWFLILLQLEPEELETRSEELKQLLIQEAQTYHQVSYL